MLMVQSNNESKTFTRERAFLPFVLVFAITVAWGIIDAVLPLHGLFFSSAQLIPLSQQFLLPSRILFPGLEITPSLFATAQHVPPPTLIESWGETALLLGAFFLLFLCYSLALKYLPQKISLRYMLIFAALFGGICLVMPTVTSPDLFSYIIYARMWAVYHLNPLVAAPIVVAKDPVYSLLYWKDQPSAYGPTWIMLTSLLQWFTNLTGTKTNVTAMVLLLRCLGLAAHLWSSILIWSIGGHLQRMHGKENSYTRVLATLAFAWNPLLLFEACVNAHNDTVMLLLILSGLWFLVQRNSLFSYVCVALMLALATCLKVNAALLVPGLLIYVWLQPGRCQKLAAVLLVYLAAVVALYVPFWDHGAILQLLYVNPGTYRNINTLPDFFGQLYNSVRHLFGSPLAPEIGSRAERMTHTFSEGLFALAYMFLCLQALFTRHRLQTPVQLIRWMTIAWFLYCLVGAPWFWPWYAVTFFGLFALVETCTISQHPSIRSIVARVFAFSLLSVYCFSPWGVYNSFIPFMAGFRWVYLRGVWVWSPVLLLLMWYFKRKHTKEKTERNYVK